VKVGSHVSCSRKCKGVGQEGSLGVTSHVLASVRKCEGLNPTPLNEFPLWELESQRTLESQRAILGVKTH
jgi:hypothetical protein